MAEGPGGLAQGKRSLGANVYLYVAEEETKEGRPRTAGRTLAAALRDPTSFRLYWALLWGAFRQLDRGKDYFEALWRVLERILVDTEEAWARRPGGS
ncbi:hypothetical protein [Thermus scotoductus]|uniref:hypothetical protein n=1 Tax=Thermus scotoductus TaxID=37636 RepID=UPI000F7D6F8A|nr:hypothetical protein [Thermus scotoductus]